MASGFVNIAKTSDEVEVAFEIENERQLEDGSFKGLQQWQYTKINIAVIGPPKSGKSSFINHLRNVQSNARGAATVDDNVTDTCISEYTYPANSKISIWELPGQKRQDKKGTTPQNDIDFDRYDFFLILSEKSFMETDNWFIKEVLQNGKPCFFVRTCIGRSVNETKLATSKRNTKNKQTALEDIRSTCKVNLQVYGVTNPTVFLVDSDDIANDFFEFGALQDLLFPMVESAKMGDISFSFDLKHTDELMNLKKELLGKRIRHKGLQASIAKTTIERMLILKQEIILQQQIFGIDEESLTKYKTLYGLPSGLMDDFSIQFDTRVRVDDSATNVVSFDKVNDIGRSRNFLWQYRRAYDCMARIRGDGEGTYICKHCIQILEESLKKVFSLRESLNKEVLTHLVREKRKERE